MLHFGVTSCESQLFGPGFDTSHLHIARFSASYKK